MKAGVGEEGGGEGVSQKEEWTLQLYLCTTLSSQKWAAQQTAFKGVLSNFNIVVESSGVAGVAESESGW